MLRFSSKNPKPLSPNQEMALRAQRAAPKEVRRRQLIEATMEIIAERGVSGATMAEVTHRAGLSIGTVNLHFGTKDNLLKSTLMYLAEEMQGLWLKVHEDPALTPAQKLWGIVDADFDPSICSHTKIRVWYGFFGEVTYRNFYRETVEPYDNDNDQALQTWLIKMLRAQDPSQSSAVLEERAAALALSLATLADGLWLSLMLYPNWISRETARRQLWALLSLHFPHHYPADQPPALEAVVG